MSYEQFRPPPGTNVEAYCAGMRGERMQTDKPSAWWDYQAGRAAVAGLSPEVATEYAAAILNEHREALAANAKGAS